MQGAITAILNAKLAEASDAEARFDLATAEMRLREAAAFQVHPLPAARLGMFLSHWGRKAEAERVLRWVMSVTPPRPEFARIRSDAAFRLAYDRLCQGDYRAANWKVLSDCFAAQFGTPSFALPEWRGEPLRGRRLLVIPPAGMGGLGDQIQFARFLPALSGRCRAVGLVCNAAVAPLFKGLGAEVFADHADPRDWDCWTSAIGLVARYGLTWDRVPAAPYIFADPIASPHRIGVKLAGNPQMVDDGRRSLPADLITELLSVPGVVDLDPANTGASDMSETARIVAGLDLVISVDTSVAHLAGAMGKPVWIMTRMYRNDWRWMTERSDSPWYPSARLYRQQTPGNWRPVIERVKADVKTLGL